MRDNLYNEPALDDDREPGDGLMTGAISLSMFVLAVCGAIFWLVF